MVHPHFHFYFDESGYPRVAETLSRDLFAVFLEFDNGNSAFGPQTLLETVKRVREEGENEIWGGDVCILEITPEKTDMWLLEAELETKIQIPLAAFEATLLAWQRFIASLSQQRADS